MKEPYWLGPLDRLRKSICEQVAHARAAKHPTIKGSSIEAILRNVIRQYLPTKYAVGTGQVANREGAVSPQVDILVYDNTTFPPLMVNEDGSVIVAAESVYAYIEVKVRRNTKLLREHFQDCVAIDRGRRPASGEIGGDDSASYFVITYQGMRTPAEEFLGDADRMVAVCPLKGPEAMISARGRSDFDRVKGNALAFLFDWLLKDCMLKSFVDVGSNSQTRIEVAPYFGWDPDGSAEPAS